MSRALTRTDVLGARDLKTERVNVPEWGGHVYVRTMTARERDDFEAVILTKPLEERKGENYRGTLLALVVVDEAGVPLFRLEDAEALGGKSVSAVNRVFNVAVRLNALSPADIAELQGNSEPGPGADSSSG